MKRALIAALPLVGHVEYVDSTKFDDGGIYQQACSVCYSTEPCVTSPFDLGVFEVSCSPCWPRGGRRPAGFDTIALSARDAVGEWLARTAALEAASVPAFRILAAELRAHGAPEALVDEALRSADDEIRHAGLMAQLSRRYGAAAAPVSIAPRPVRTLEAIAVENAVEGLVREAYGALVAITPTIGADERRHAALAAEVHAWIRPRLALAARRRVDDARDEARAALVAECAVEPAPPLRALGLPDATRAVALAATI
jgi:hypothetical protein